MTIDPGELEDDDAGLEEVLNPNLRQEIKDARKTKRDLARVQQELDTERRERVFAEAGIPDSGPAKYFRKGYEGDLTAEAIKAQAAADGIIAPPEADAQREQELETQRRMAGAVREGGEDQPDPHEGLQADLRGTKSKAELLERLNQAQRDGVPGVRIAIQGDRT